MGAGRRRCPTSTAASRASTSAAFLLQQLAAGAKDEQIARTLGLSLRTVRRRVADLMIELGADTRFQAGVEAVRARLALSRPRCTVAVSGGQHHASTPRARRARCAAARGRRSRRRR